MRGVDCRTVWRGGSGPTPLLVVTGGAQAGHPRGRQCGEGGSRRIHRGGARSPSIVPSVTSNPPSSLVDSLDYCLFYFHVMSLLLAFHSSA